MTRPLDPAALLPELVTTSTNDEDRAEIAELLAEFSAITASEAAEAEVVAGRTRLLNAVGAGSERFAPFFDRLLEFFDMTADALREVFARAERASEWVPGPIPTISLLHFAGGPSVAGLDTGFVKFAKGSVFPTHHHGGSERVLVIAGSCHDHEQRLFVPGDRHDMAAGTEHSLHMSPDEDVWLAVIIAGEISFVGAP